MQSSSPNAAGGGSTVNAVSLAAADPDAGDFAHQAPPVDTAVHGRQGTERGAWRGGTLRR